MLVGLVDGLGGKMELRGFTVANFFENPEFSKIFFKDPIILIILNFECRSKQNLATHK